MNDRSPTTTCHHATLAPPRHARLRHRAHLIIAAAALSWFGCVSHGHGGDDPGGTPPGIERVEYFKGGALETGRARFDAKDWKGAASALSAALEANPLEVSLSPDERLRARLLLGMSQLRGGDAAAALTTLRALAKDDPLLEDYAWALAAEAALEAKDPEEAARLAEQVDPGALLYPDSLLTLGRARIESGRSQDAARTLEMALRLVAPEGAVARALSLELARAHEVNGRLVLAAELLMGLIEAHGRSVEGEAAAALLEEIAPRLSEAARARLEKPTPPKDPMAKARAMYENHRSKEVIPILESLRKKFPRDRHPSRWCESTYLLAKSHSKLRDHKTAAPIYDEVIERCETVEDYHLRGLYNAGRAHWNADSSATAIETYQALIKKYPEHSYADDAWINIARIQLEQGKQSEAIASLETQVEQYPTGDMAKDAHWLVFNEHYQGGRYDAAIAYVDAHGENAAEDDLYTRGRLAYFRVRCLEHKNAKPAEIIAGFEAVVRAQPLSFYAMQAFGRLGVLDAKRAKALARELRPGPHDPEADALPSPPEALKGDPAFQRGRELLKLGLVSWGEQELDRVQVDAGAQGALKWQHTVLLQGIGQYTRSHRKAATLVDVDNATRYLDAKNRGRWALAYPRPFIEHVWPQAAEQSLPPHLVYAIMREESAFEPTIESWANARGLMQLMLPTAQSTASDLRDPKPSAQDLFKPAVAIRLGAAYMNTLAELFGRHPYFIVSGYNAGQGTVGRWLKERGDQSIDLWVESIPYGQTQRYTKRVLMSFWRYHWLHDDGDGLLGLDPATPAREAAASKKR